jgi:hypothetical protein
MRKSGLDSSGTGQGEGALCNPWEILDWRRTYSLLSKDSVIWRVLFVAVVWRRLT